jgi:choline dehydrogenase-like flavoprotein
MSGAIHRGAEFDGDHEISCDVAVIGSGPGGSIMAATLAEVGARVAILEEGPDTDRSEFDMEEGTAYPRLYQDQGSRATDDLAIMILQGRSVGGGTTVNWMTCFRTPETTLEVWERRHGVSGIHEESLGPHFSRVERRLNVHAAGAEDVNPNNRVLLDGATRLGYQANLLLRNSDGCENLGYCGMGCPVEAKKTSTLTFLRDAVRCGAEVFADCRAERLEASGRRVAAVRARNLETGVALTLRARTVVLAGGAINTPVLLLRSGLGGPAVGRRTWIHPVTATVAEFPHPVEAYYGSPQSVGSRHFAERGSRMGYFIETPPVHPMLAALAIPAFGAVHRNFMERLPRTSALIGLTIDGFSKEERGGTVKIDRSGRGHFFYPLGERNREAIVEAMKTMARIQLAAGALRVHTLHTQPVEIRREEDLPRIEKAPFGPNRLSLFTAHQMGGCAMGEDPKTSVVDSRGRHHDLDNLYVCDGSVFPTGLGVNPMISIYAVASLFAAELAKRGE